MLKKIILTSLVCFLFLLFTEGAMATEKPWEDWPITSIEEDLDAGWYVKSEGIFQGYKDGLFHPEIPITSFQFGVVLGRAKIPAEDYVPVGTSVTIEETQKYLPGTAWSSKPEDLATRFRTAVMIYRYKNGIVAPETIDKQIAAKIEELFKEHPHSWQGVSRYSRMVGHADTIVRCSKQYNVPISLCLAQCWAESCWFTGGKSLEFNMGFGMKDRLNRWGAVGNPSVIGDGFTNYISIDESIEAYFRLMSSPIMPCRALIDKWIETGDINYVNQLLDIYAPPYENDPNLKRTVSIVIGWVNSKGIK
jgi:hypothetical protein